MDDMPAPKDLHRDLRAEIKSPRMEWDLLQHFGPEDLVTRRFIRDPRTGNQHIGCNRQDAVCKPVRQLHVLWMSTL